MTFVCVEVIYWLILVDHLLVNVLCPYIFFRLAKEKVMYEKEVVDQQQKIDKMKADVKYEHDIRKQVQKWKLLM